MSVSRYMEDIPASQGNTLISETHFGANHVGTVNFALEGGPYDAAVEAMGITHLRYPGGTVTEEKIDPGSAVWDQLLASGGPGYVELEDGQRIQTLESTLDFASANDLTVNLVLPTNFLLTEDDVGFREPDIAAIDKMVQDLVQFVQKNPEAAHIGTIEIGNEYYYDGRMTAGEYGSLANEMVNRLEAAFTKLEAESEDGFRAPDLAVQSGAGWQRGDNETIMTHLDDDARAAVDAVVLHYYPKSLEAVPNFDRHLNELDAWREDPSFGDLKFYASEWNIQNGASSDKGFMQASAFVSAFDEMLEEGIDMASVWGTQYRSLDSRLATLSKRDAGDAASQKIDTDLTATGEIFSIMRNSLVGTHSLDIAQDRFLTASAGADHTFDTFGSADRFVGFIGSRETTDDMTLRLDLEAYFGSQGHVSLRVLYPTDDPGTPDIDESDPTIAKAEADLDFLYSGSLEDALLEVTLPPGAILIVEVTLNDDGVFLQGQNPISDEAFFTLEDEINGSDGDDTLLGHSGNDTLSGGDGRDILGGGTGNDSLLGGKDADLLLGDAGNDTLSGGEDGDILFGGDGDDNLEGDEGDDVLFGGGGNDTVSGGDGNDLIVTTAGDNQLSGGEGADHFAFFGTGHQTIADFSFDQGDSIDVSAHFEDDEALQAALDEAVEGATEEGKVTLSLGEEASVTFDMGEAALADIYAAFGIGAETSETFLRLGEALNGQSFDQAAVTAGNLPDEMVDRLVEGDELQDFADSLEPHALMGVLSGLDGEDTAALVDQLGNEALMEAVGDLSEEELVEFITGTGGEQLETIFSEVSAAQLDAVWSGLSAPALREIDDHLDGTSVPRPVLPAGEDLPEEPAVPVVQPVKEEEQDPEEEDEETASGTATGDCFIATVAFRDPHHPSVQMLRWYRDMVLRRSRTGRAMVALYWKYGPALAIGLKDHPHLTSVIRAALHLVALGMAFLTGRSLGQQSDHVAWPENRACRLPLSRQPGLGWSTARRGC